MGTMIVAEIGVNHRNSVEHGKIMCREARSCGADAVKFQMFHPDLVEPPGPEREMLSQMFMDRSDIIDIAEFASSIGLKVGVTPFDLISGSWARSQEVFDFIKIASSSADDVELMTIAASSGKTVMVSTGMVRKAVGRAVEVFYRHQLSTAQELVVMHCVSEYPTPCDRAGLRMIRVVENLCRNAPIVARVGYSDHTTSTLIPALAVAAGAEVIEKHFTLTPDAPGGDHAMSLPPSSFRSMVENIRIADGAMPDRGVSRGARDTLARRQAFREEIRRQRYLSSA